MKSLKILLAITILVAMTGEAPGAFADNPPTVSITSPSSGAVAKGKLSIATQFGADSSGTASISEIGISIANAPSGYTQSLTLDGYSSNPTTLGSTNVDAAWTSTYWNGSSATFKVDTTSWPAGTYSITATVLDTNGRTTTSAPVAFVIPAPVQILLTESSNVGTQEVLTATLSGATSLQGGSIILQSSTTSEGPWSDSNAFTGNGTSYSLTSQLPLGTWVQAKFSGSSTLLDSNSSPIQLLGVPSVVCSMPARGKVNSPVKGVCTFKNISGSFPISLMSKATSGWSTLAKASIQKLSIPISITPKIIGKLQVRVTSTGVLGLYKAFSSNIVVVNVSRNGH